MSALWVKLIRTFGLGWWRASPSRQARELEKTAASKGVEIILPTDVVVADAFSADANSQVPQPKRFSECCFVLVAHTNSNRFSGCLRFWVMSALVFGVARRRSSSGDADTPAAA